MKYPEWMNSFCEFSESFSNKEKNSHNKRETEAQLSFIIDLPNSMFINGISIKELKGILEARAAYEELPMKKRIRHFSLTRN